MINLKRNLILDGAMGTLLYERLKPAPGYAPELFNLAAPDAVLRAHRDYIDAGADVVSSNTFGANPFKTEDYASLIARGIDIVCEAAGGETLKAFDIGPCGKLLGEEFSFEECVEIFKRVIAAGGERTDFIYLETFTDLRELRAALIAARECSSLPVVASMTFGKNLRTPFGNPVDAFVLTAAAAGAAAVGANCSVGPREMLGAAEIMTRSTDLPVFIKPNAGMPRLVGGKTIYDVNAETFAAAAARIKSETGVEAVGGCCGTSPQYIAELKRAVGICEAARSKLEAVRAICCAGKTVYVDGVTTVGERINPTGKKRFKDALLAGDYDYAVACGIEQEDAGADILDVNVGVNGIDESAVMASVARRLERVINLPLQFDTSNPDALEAALRGYCGKAIVNSVNATVQSLETVLPLVVKYGAAVIALPIDESGIPKSVEERVTLARKLIAECLERGMLKENIYVDALTLSEASERGSARVTLDTLSEIKKLGVGTVLGISNVSFGMPCRTDINAAFLALAKERGLDLAIINPALKGVEPTSFAFDFLSGEEGAADRYVDFCQGRDSKEKPYEAVVTTDLKQAVLTGQKDLAAKLAGQLAQSLASSEIAARHIVPALDEIGAAYERGEAFLPKLISAADAAKAAFDVILAVSPQPDGDRRFVVATVKGDVHDIGKNIVKAVTSNYGYNVIDLGKDVGYDEVLSAIEQYYPCVLGLSALMTTTVDTMERTIKLVKQKYDIPVLVGGAVLTRDYAERIGGIYCADANATVRELDKIFAKGIE